MVVAPLVFYRSRGLDVGQVASQSSGAATLVTVAVRFIEAMEKSGWVEARATRVANFTLHQRGCTPKKRGIEVRRIQRRLSHLRHALSGARRSRSAMARGSARTRWWWWKLLRRTSR